jgi:hypothetical protein
LKITKIMLLFVVVVLLSCTAIGYGVTSSYNSSNLPFVPASQGSTTISLLSPGPPTLKSGCATLVLDSSQSIIPKFAGNPSTLVYGCGKKGAGSAFTTAPSPNSMTSTIVATFAIPTGWRLGVGVAKPSRDCSTSDGVVTLTSGSELTLRSGTNYIYCLTTGSASSFKTFTVTWS